MISWLAFRCVKRHCAWARAGGNTTASDTPARPEATRFPTHRNFSPPSQFKAPARDLVRDVLFVCYTCDVITYL
ncbi:unnamed protein product [Leptosia nina]|uniref:Uncharacterized protein n=1 Tax=Leptosia nina TaxID=320188 RepID=A0AAV1JKR4_9NEOP